MKKNILILITLLISSVMAAQKFTTKTGNIRFEASVPSFEEVAGESKTASAVVVPETGDIAVLTLIKGFRFKVALMEEHFNENYVESDKYPKATFKGKIEGFDISKISAEAKTYTVAGDLTLHGKTKHITGPAKVSKQGNTLTITGAFDVKPADFDIEVPAVVSKKIADKIKVTYNLQLTK
ncbi:YceI family protein [Flavobacterium sp. RHBU_24]|uniref:YceI family protein n=1 Tax=Flavobacterium sp. RHBU_24 TaxID=3391185 RepID=UPI00398565A6